jgi:anti-sigma-K factor RskA
MNDHVEELLALYALGGLEPDELRRVEAHLAGCAACRREADQWLGLTALVGQSALPVKPKPELRPAVLRRIQNQRPRRAAAPPRRVLGPALNRAFAALGVVALVSLLGWNLALNAQLNGLRGQLAQQEQLMTGLRDQIAEQTQLIEGLSRQAEAQQAAASVVASATTHTVNLAAPGSQPVGSGRAFVSEGAQTVVIVVQLRPLDPTQTYQTWLVTDAGPQPSDVFSVNAEGIGLITVQVPDQLANFTAIGISLEPAGGSQTPTEVVLVGGL